MRTVCPFPLRLCPHDLDPDLWRKMELNCQKRVDLTPRLRKKNPKPTDWGWICFLGNQGWTRRADFIGKQLAVVYSRYVDVSRNNQVGFGTEACMLLWEGAVWSSTAHLLLQLSGEFFTPPLLVYRDFFSLSGTDWCNLLLLFQLCFHSNSWPSRSSRRAGSSGWKGLSRRPRCHGSPRNPSLSFTTTRCVKQRQKRWNESKSSNSQEVTIKFWGDPH